MWSCHKPNSRFHPYIAFYWWSVLQTHLIEDKEKRVISLLSRNIASVNDRNSFTIEMSQLKREIILSPLHGSPKIVFYIIENNIAVEELVQGFYRKQHIFILWQLTIQPNYFIVISVKDWISNTKRKDGDFLLLLGNKCY